MKYFLEPTIVLKTHTPKSAAVLHNSPDFQPRSVDGTGNLVEESDGIDSVVEFYTVLQA